MLICIYLAASSGSSTDVVNMLPTDRQLQLKLEEACQTSQTSGPVTAVKDVMITQDQKSNFIALYLFFACLITLKSMIRCAHVL